MNARMIIWVIDCFIIQQGRASFKPFVSFAAYVKYERSYSSSTKTTPSSLTTRESHSASPLYSPLHAHGDRRHSSVNAMYYPTTDREWMKKLPILPPSLGQFKMLNSFMCALWIAYPLTWFLFPYSLSLLGSSSCWTQCCVPCELRSLGRGSSEADLGSKSVLVVD